MLSTYPSVKLKFVFRKDKVSGIYRVARVYWSKKIENPAYKYCLTFGLRKNWFYFHYECKFKGYKSWILCLLGLRLHYKSDERGCLV